MPVSTAYLKAARRAGIRRVIAYWGAPMSSENRGLKLALKRLEVALVRREKPDFFIFESEAMRRLGVMGRGLAESSTSVVHTGVDTGMFRPMPESAGLVYERFAIPSRRRVVVYMGHLDQRKGVHVLMRAVAHIGSRMRRDDVHCLFLGNRPGEEHSFAPHWEQAAAYITFGGYQSEIPQLLAGCYAGCIPSTGWDSFPMSSLEMQACGLPVIVSDWQGVPETVKDGLTGVVTPAGDVVALAREIVALVDAPDRRDRMGTAARQHIETNLTRDHQISNLVDCLKRQLVDA